MACSGWSPLDWLEAGRKKQVSTEVEMEVWMEFGRGGEMGAGTKAQKRAPRS